jgi:hypothetical protein
VRPLLPQRRVDPQQLDRDDDPGGDDRVARAVQKAGDQRPHLLRRLRRPPHEARGRHPDALMNQWRRRVRELQDVDDQRLRHIRGPDIRNQRERQTLHSLVRVP